MYPRAGRFGSFMPMLGARPASGPDAGARLVDIWMLNVEVAPDRPECPSRLAAPPYRSGAPEP